MLPRLALELEVLAEIGEDLPVEDVTYEWRVLSGPGSAVFTHPAQLHTTVVLDQAGDYEVELLARCPAPLVEARSSFTVSLLSPPPEVATAGGETEIVTAAGTVASMPTESPAHPTPAGAAALPASATHTRAAKAARES